MKDLIIPEINGELQWTVVSGKHSTQILCKDTKVSLNASVQLTVCGVQCPNEKYKVQVMDIKMKVVSADVQLGNLPLNALAPIVKSGCSTYAETCKVACLFDPKCMNTKYNQCYHQCYDVGVIEGLTGSITNMAKKQITSHMQDAVNARADDVRDMVNQHLQQCI